MRITRETFNVTIPELFKIREEVFEAMTDWMIKHGAYSEESVMQCDRCIIGAPELIADIIDDIIKPEIKENEII